MRFSEEKLIATYRFVDPRPMLVDVGAHEGTVTRLFAAMGWDVIAFEPELENRRHLKQNTAGMDNVICIPKAVSDRTGELLPFYVSSEHFGIHSLRPFHNTHSEADYKVVSVRLDDALAELAVDRVSFLKIDVEGADYPALKGFNFGKYRPEIIVVEFMDSRSLPNFGYTHHDMCSYMEENGYIAYVSEWAPVREYGRKGQAGVQHRWIRCEKYPLAHTPAWGNLIFIHPDNEEKFLVALRGYLQTGENPGRPGLMGRVLRSLRRFIRPRQT